MLTSSWQYSLLTIYQFTLEFSMKFSIIVQHMRSIYDYAFSKGQKERKKKKKGASLDDSMAPLSLF